MKRLKFTLRDLFWLTLVVAIAIAWQHASIQYRADLTQCALDLKLERARTAHLSAALNRPEVWGADFLELDRLAMEKRLIDHVEELGVKRHWRLRPAPKSASN